MSAIQGSHLKIQSAMKIYTKISATFAAVSDRKNVLRSDKTQLRDDIWWWVSTSLSIWVHDSMSAFHNAVHYGYAGVHCVVVLDCCRQYCYRNHNNFESGHTGTHDSDQGTRFSSGSWRIRPQHWAQISGAFTQTSFLCKHGALTFTFRTLMFIPNTIICT